jgi:hypothetical protein
MKILTLIFVIFTTSQDVLAKYMLLRSPSSLDPLIDVQCMDSIMLVSGLYLGNQAYNVIWDDSILTVQSVMYGGGYLMGKKFRIDLNKGWLKSIDDTSSFPDFLIERYVSRDICISTNWNVGSEMSLVIRSHKRRVKITETYSFYKEGLEIITGNGYYYELLYRKGVLEKKRKVYLKRNRIIRRTVR